MEKWSQLLCICVKLYLYVSLQSSTRQSYTVQYCSYKIPRLENILSLWFLYLTLPDRADCLDRWFFDSWYQLCSPMLQMVAIVRWLNWVILAVGWFSSSSVQHLVVYTIDLQDRIHLLHKPHPFCCNTKTSPYPAKVGRGSVISWRYRACSPWYDLPGIKSKTKKPRYHPVVTSPPIVEASRLDFRNVLSTGDFRRV